jgi:hypothetical protein
MSKSQKRYHLENKATQLPQVQEAFKLLGALLIATNAKDLESDFSMEDKDTGKLRQFHLEIAEVQP